MELSSGCYAPEDFYVEPAQATADVIFLNGAREKNLIKSEQLNSLQRDFLEYFSKLHADQKEDIFREAKQFAESKRTHLRDSEVICLLVAFLASREKRAVGYADVLDFVFTHEAKLSEATIFKAFGELEAIHLIARAPGRHVTRAGRPRELFNLTSFGLIALELAVAYEKHLRACREQAAA